MLIAPEKKAAFLLPLNVRPLIPESVIIPLA
jgi:hypothetical protein